MGSDGVRGLLAGAAGGLVALVVVAATAVPWTAGGPGPVRGVWALVLLAVGGLATGAAVLAGRRPAAGFGLTVLAGAVLGLALAPHALEAGWGVSPVTMLGFAGRNPAAWLAVGVAAVRAGRRAP